MTFVILAAMIAAPPPCPLEPPVPAGKVVNPEYATWSKFPVGTFTTIKFQANYDEVGTEKFRSRIYTATKTTLVAITAEQVELRAETWEEHKLNRDPEIRTIEHKPAKVVHPRFVNQTGPGNSKVIDTYEKEIEFAGKKVKARFTKTEEGGFDAIGTILTIKRWTSDEVPGGLVDQYWAMTEEGWHHTELTSCVKPGEWQPLFNGKNLAGWRANNDPGSFMWMDGTIRVQASGKIASHLFYVGDHKEGFEKFTNFELEATVKAEPDANSGIFFHTAMTANAKGHLDKGYEVQLNSTEKEKRKTGSLYAVVDLDKSPVDETKWFTVRIVVNGKRITVAVNGKEVVDYTEPKDAVRPKERAGRLLSADGGGIALQAHDAKSVWYSKDVRIKRLP